MTSLTTSLRSLSNSLGIIQDSIAAVGDNIAGVNSEGYVRKAVNVATSVANGNAVGVTILEVERSVDEFINAALRDQLSLYAAAKVKDDFQTRIQNFTFGDPNSSFTISSTMNSFFSAMESFANDPTSSVKASLVVSAASAMADSINTVAYGLHNERFNADTEIENQVNNLNNALVALGDINDAIRINSIAKADISSLLDARDLQLRAVKEIIDADVTFDEFGQVSINLSNTELLSPGNSYLVEFTRSSSVETMINGSATSAITVTSYNSAGELTNNTTTLMSASNDVNYVNDLPSGTLKALTELRDTDIPKLIEQLDSFAYSFASAMNEVHNNGSSFPPPSSITATSAVSYRQENYYGGSFRISLTDDTGRPLTNRYGQDLIPLTVNLDELVGTNGRGLLSLNDILNEINSYYGNQAENSVNVGSADNIKMVSLNNSFNAVSATGVITFSDLPSDGDTIEINGTTFTFVNSTAANTTQITIGASIVATVQNTVTVLSSSTDSSVNVANYSANSNKINISYNNAGTTGNGFTVDVSGASNLSASGANLTGGSNVSGEYEFDFEFTNIDSNGLDVTFDVEEISINGGTSSAVTFGALTAAAGNTHRTFTSSNTTGSISLDLTSLGLEEGESFEISAKVRVTDANGNETTETITYTVTIPDPEEDTINERYSVSSISGTEDGVIVAADTTNGFMSAYLVDANGNILSPDSTEQGYLRLQSANSDIRISLDQLTSEEQGTYGASNVLASATHKGLFHYFGLNNFFEFGNDSVTNAAYNISVRDDITETTSLLSRGKAIKTLDDAGVHKYTYEIGAGSNQVALQMNKVQDNNITFSAAGGFDEVSTTLSAYITDIYNFSAIMAVDASSDFENQQLLFDSLENAYQDASGVNLDVELANTVFYQSAYAANARVLAVVKELFEKTEEALS